GLAYTTGEGNILTGAAAWNTHYASWGASGGLGSKIDAVVVGSANMMATMGISKTIGIVIMGVFISSFAGTTLDSATRIQRYIISELCTSLKISVMTNRYIATLFAVCTAALLAFVTGLDGKGALTLWPVFGSVNQLLAALALILLTIYLRGRGGLKYLVTALPGLFMTIMTLWSIIFNEITFIEQRNWLLISLNTTIFILAVWMIIESMLVFMRGKKD
ncbi:MAG: carbon starvation CstA 5TM domain-containing protein, partial [Candidatus Omnitrophota bacterium]